MFRIRRRRSDLRPLNKFVCFTWKSSKEDDCGFQEELVSSLPLQGYRFSFWRTGSFTRWVDFRTNTKVTLHPQLEICIGAFAGGGSRNTTSKRGRFYYFTPPTRGPKKGPSCRTPFLCFPGRDTKPVGRWGLNRVRGGERWRGDPGRGPSTRDSNQSTGSRDYLESI